MSIIDDLLSNSFVKIKNPSDVESKLHKIIKDGYENLMILADFDYTLSKFKDTNGKECLITHSIFVKCTQEVKPELSEKLQVICNKYGPLEHSTKISRAEKLSKMEDWWNLSHECIVDSKLSHDDIKKFVKDAPLYLRDFAVEFIRFIEAKNVPLIVFSAGIGNVIEMILQQNLGTIPSQLHIISNFMNFNKKNICESFTEPTIHSCCKNSTVITGEQPYSEDIKSRPNIILLGDSLEDVHMDIGMVNESTAIKIGFLNHSIDSRFDDYSEAFDILLIDCQSMEIPFRLLKLCENFNFKIDNNLNAINNV
uniref:5'-nucleotidase n=1 Tax=Panagrolaimus sp. ES5 TaxID=591445 RepID=A0AC34F8I3_9BILA